ncbi:MULTISPECIES: hypothetical protein [Stenotrophomonas]|jgi:hypothetical protein|uniref:hypothetical protein n=1 Tax=Stenotrophomonas TaxID=40323 RepID=UPI000B2ABBC8|nr:MULTISPECIES: hypothetical protein [Stenotrophomonas]MCA7023881.1 hypothetical protein [Stenotrophomonas acidaminiphila]MCE4076097.1 hypothetical protein [Stenotrophomonas acidaminiphila]WHL18894.1 hypothetical protein QLF99_00070 [Stenotrophomonas acidaminiphila]
MYWLSLLLALGAFTVSITTTHSGLMLLSLLAALLLLLLWMKGLYAARFGSTTRQAPRPLHAAELQALRDQLRPPVPPAAPPSSPAPEEQPPS